MLEGAADCMPSHRWVPPPGRAMMKFMLMNYCARSHQEAAREQAAIGRSCAAAAGWLRSQRASGCRLLGLVAPESLGERHRAFAPSLWS